MKFKILILILTYVSYNLYANDFSANLKDDLNASLKDFSNITKIINLSHLFYTSQIILSDIMIMNNDDKMRDYVLSNKNNHYENLMHIIDNFGLAVPLPFVIYGIGLAADNSSWRKTGRLMVESLILSTAITQSFKIILSRSRPFNNDGPYEFKFFEFQDKYWSHPSGHTAVVFSFATILAFRINTWWSYPLFYGLAAGTGFARMYFDKHWLSDVFLAATIGTASSLLILKSSNITDNKSNNVNLTIQPSFNFINFTYSW